ncbi:MAG: hypothetical protein HGA78_03460 [Nitrospirales bacterium]|nr:hypothetical protein [Nitrospirales bacterium]
MKLYLIDGNSYIYRAFHAIRSLTNSKGFPTNAIYGFTNMLMKVIREKKPDGLAVVFDSPGPTERHRIYEEYKAHRPPMPNEMVPQIPYIREMVSAFRIPCFAIPGHEADDIICTIAKRAASEGADVFILSGDKDMMQVVGNGIRIYDPMKELVIDATLIAILLGLARWIWMSE